MQPIHPPQEQEALATRASAFFCVVISLLLSTTGCSSTTQFDALQIQLNEIQTQLRQLQLEASSKEEISTLGSTVQEDTAALLRSQADLRDAVRQLSARVEAAEDAQRVTAASLAELPSQVAELLSAVESLQDTLDRHDRTPQATPIDASNPERLYQAAYDDFLRANYDLALAGFRRFLEVFPAHSLADNALYWIGECYFSRGEYRAAIQEFEGVAERFPASDRLATTLLRQAGAFVELGERERATRLLRDVIERFPSSDEAVLAQQQLSNLRN